MMQNKYRNNAAKQSKLGVTEDVPPIAELWNSRDVRAWEYALVRYWSFVQPANLELERTMEALDLSRIRALDAKG